MGQLNRLKRSDLTYVDRVDTLGNPRDTFVYGDYILVVSDRIFNGVELYDRDTLERLGSAPVDGDFILARANSMVGDFLFVSSGSGDGSYMSIFNLNALPTLHKSAVLNSSPRWAGPSAKGRLLLTGILVSSSPSVSAYSIEDPSNPVLLDSAPTVHGVRGSTVIGDYLVVSGSEMDSPYTKAITVFDISSCFVE